MSRFSEYNVETGEYQEGRLGEACCPICGYPMLAKYSEQGELMEVLGSCPGCGEEA